MKKFLVVLILSLPAFGQTSDSGPGLYTGSAMYGGMSGGAPRFFAALPIYWVDNTICNPPGGVYDTTVILGTTINSGPNDAGGAIGSPYALTPAGLEDAMNNWRDNADDASQTPHFADAWWLIEVPAQSSGVVLHGNIFDGNNALISLPGKVNEGAEPTKCLVVDSTTPLPAGQMVCGRGLPGFGGARNPGCSSPNDKASMWKVNLDAPLGSAGRTAVYAGADLATPTNWTNHVVLRDVEITLSPGVAQSGQGPSTAPYLFRAHPNITSAAPCSTATPCISSAHIGLDRYYAHGWDPGDPGQPAGACSVWTNAGTGIGVAPDGANPGTSIVTLPASGYSGSYFGMTFAVGSTITINGNNYTVANTSYTQGVLNGAQNTELSITGSVTLAGASFTQSNPPAQYANGCGDDVVNAVDFDCDSCWRQNGYIEKIHWWQSESHASSQGFSNGPYKDVNNWEEGASAAWFNGGAPVDQRGGPEANVEVRRNYFGRDLNYRQLSATAGNSPAPPWGCGPSDGIAAHNTCPFSWAVKNSVELKLGNYVLFDGNIIENSWPDAQTGWCVVVGPRTESGGGEAGIYNQANGLPLTGISNIRFSNNWVRNCAEPFTTGSRSDPSTANGGGISLPVENNDYINNLMSNINDTAQNGNPNEQWVWGLGSESYTCSMSYTGSGPYTATATCLPEQVDITAKTTKIASVLASGASCTNFGFPSPCSQVEIYNSYRLDPMLCATGPGFAPPSSYSPGVSANCIANGWTLVLANHAGWNGTFAMTGTTGNWYGDGTGGNNIYYLDAVNNPGVSVLCDNSGSPTCSSLLASGDLTFASLGTKMTDISVGDGVYASNVGGAGNDTSCSAYGYAVGATSATYASTGTITTGLTVVYQVPTQPTAATATCILKNSAGFLKNIAFENNTELCPDVCSVESYSTWQQSIENVFINNVWADNDSGYNSDVNCTAASMEGTLSFACWDLNTFEFYNNVLAGRGAANWSVADPASLCPGCLNYFPQSGLSGSGANTGVNCSGPTATAGCMGYTGFMGSSPTVTFPAGSCSATNAPFNCPLMALPWANNFTLSDVSYVGSSSYPSSGVNTTQLQNAMTRTEYVCPGGANCGTHGPYPD